MFNEFLVLDLADKLKMDLILEKKALSEVTSNIEKDVNSWRSVRNEEDITGIKERMLNGSGNDSSVTLSIIWMLL